MASAKKVAANRRNARRSTGPRTAQGKAKSARNAVRHGILNRSPVIEDFESQAEWQDHLEATLSALEPVGYLELTLARRVALQTWRLERVRRCETALASERIAGVERENWVDSCGAVMAEISNAVRDRDVFEAITKMKPFESVPVSLAIRILKRIASANGLVLDEDNLGIESCGQNAAEAVAESWPASEVVRIAGEIGEQGGLRPDTALMISVDTGVQEWGARRVRLRERCERRLLPEPPRLEVLQRYDGAIERSLYRALHEIERLQVRRTGGEVPAPVAVDLTIDSVASGAE